MAVPDRNTTKTVVAALFDGKIKTDRSQPLAVGELLGNLTSAVARHPSSGGQ